MGVHKTIVNYIVELFLYIWAIIWPLKQLKTEQIICEKNHYLLTSWSFVKFVRACRGVTERSCEPFLLIFGSRWFPVVLHNALGCRGGVIRDTILHATHSFEVWICLQKEEKDKRNETLVNFLLWSLRVTSYQKRNRECFPGSSSPLTNTAAQQDVFPALFCAKQV